MWKLIPLQYKLIGAGVLVAGLFATHLAKVSDAYNAGKKDAMAAVKEADNQELLLAHERANKLEAELIATQQRGVIQRAEEKLAYAKDLQDISARFASGAERLRCPSVQVHTPANPANTAPASGPTTAEGGYLMPGTAAIVQRIARTDYENVRDYNEVVRLYNEMQAACNDRRNQPK